MSGDPITLVIGGIPIAKGRVRMRRMGHAYTPSSTRKYEAHGRLVAQQAMDGRPPIDGPVCAEIDVTLPAPMSWSTKRRDAALRGEIRPTSRPDCDNYIKAALDILNAIVIADDCLIVEIIAAKCYGPVPQLRVTITPIDAVASNRKAQR
jgi:Holliday junction resolvase RusA-like endonuclease